MKYIVYLTINTKSSVTKIYVGVHRTENPDIFDGYIGDGVYINLPNTYMYPKTPFLCAVKKFGVRAFKRITLYEYDSEKAAKKKKSEIVDGTFIKLAFTYNTAELNVQSENRQKQVYVYLSSGKLFRTFDSTKECACFIGESEDQILQAILEQRVIAGQYYISNSVKEAFIPKARANYLHETFYVYDIKGDFIGSYQSKEVMPIIAVYSWRRIRDIMERQNGWYKNFYLSNTPVTQLPEKYDSNRVKVDVYDNFGKFIETVDSVKEVKQRYNVPSSKIKNLELGEKHFNNYIFKYHSSK